MKLRLAVVSRGTLEGMAIPITKSKFVIGRDPECQLRPSSRFVSHRHCAILIRGDQAFVRDFGSTNGTFLNERQLQGEIELKHGDELRVGPLIFRVSLKLGTAPDRPTPMPPMKSEPAAEEAMNSLSPPTPMPPTRLSQQRIPRRRRTRRRLKWARKMPRRPCFSPHRGQKMPALSRRPTDKTLKIARPSAKGSPSQLGTNPSKRNRKTRATVKPSRS
jgi:pSer/pThr/pTyr-binding forkhead associated (FHA) protein